MSTDTLNSTIFKVILYIIDGMFYWELKYPKLGLWHLNCCSLYPSCQATLKTNHMISSKKKPGRSLYVCYPFWDVLYTMYHINKVISMEAKFEVITWTYFFRRTPQGTEVFISEWGFFIVPAPTSLWFQNKSSVILFSNDRRLNRFLQYFFSKYFTMYFSKI